MSSRVLVTPTSTHRVAIAACRTIKPRAPLAKSLGGTFMGQGHPRPAEYLADSEDDLRLRLFTSPSEGSETNSTIALVPTPIAGGLLMAGLDVGVLAFDATERWLEIAVDGITPSPRQPVLPAPVVGLAPSHVHQRLRMPKRLVA